MSNILIIEDDHKVLHWIKNTLVQMSHEIFESKEISITNLVANITKNKIELIVLGLHNLTLDLLDSLNQKPETETIPVLIIVKETKPELLATFLDKGVYGFLNQDFDDVYIKARVSSALKTYTYINRYKELNRRLEIKNEKMDEFVAIVSHDLRIPIGNLNSICEILEENPEMLKEMLPPINTTVKNATSLINDLLDLTAFETGKACIEKQKYSISELFRQTIQETKYFGKKKKIDITFDVEHDLFVNVDIRKILQVLTNLVTNAIKFTYSGGEIKLTAHLEGEQVKVIIQDNGVGIDSEKIPYLFNKHSKTSSQGTSGEKGTGFGLPLSQNYVKAHGFEIEVCSTPMKGSTFFFYLENIAS